MKKEKYKILLTALTIIATFFLTINLYIQEKENNCRLEVNNLYFDYVTKYSEHNQKLGELFFLVQSGLIENLTNIKIEEKNIYWSSDKKLIPSLTKQFSTITKVLDELEDIPNRINLKTKNCNYLAKWKISSLYIALVLIIVSLILNIFILKLYKT